MTTVGEILSYLEERMPLSLAEDWDNVGLLAGDQEQPVRRVLCALDVTEGVIEEAAARDAQLIVAHHPLIFTPVHTVTADHGTGRALLRTIRQEISVICMHTNADCAEGGVNDVLAETLGLADIVSMEAGENLMMGRVGNLETEMQPRDFAAYVKARLGASGVRFADGGRAIRRVAVGGGSCGKLMGYALKKDADAFVIGDCSYDLMQRAQSLGLTLVDAGHFPTENPMTAVFAAWTREKFPQLDVVCSETHRDCVEFL